MSAWLLVTPLRVRTLTGEVLVSGVAPAGALEVRPFSMAAENYGMELHGMIQDTSVADLNALRDGVTVEVDCPLELQVRRIAQADGPRFARDLELVKSLEPPFPTLQRFVQLDEVDVFGSQPP